MTNNLFSELPVWTPKPSKLSELSRKDSEKGYWFEIKMQDGRVITALHHEISAQKTRWTRELQGKDLMDIEFVIWKDRWFNANEGQWEFGPLCWELPAKE